MEFSRDVSILVIEHFVKKMRKSIKSTTNIKLLDGLAGTGIRGVRVGNEVLENKFSNVNITVNDHNPMAHKMILKNIELNKLESTIPSKCDLNRLLTKNWFNYIDIDPFGSPITFLDSACRMLRNNGIMAITATDTAALFGRYPTTCHRRYDARSGRTGFSHELGLRILLGCAVRTAARYNLGLNPLLVHATDYYYRLYLLGTFGRVAADNSLAELGFVLPIHNNNEYRIIPIHELYSDLGNNEKLQTIHHEEVKANSTKKMIGPLWIGKLYDRDFVNDLKIGSHKLGTENMILNMFNVWSEEADAPLGFYDTNLIASELKLSTPPISKIIEDLRSQGFVATRTHFKANAFKTDATFSDITAILKD
jgi:tRNA (guanine26-N2/guanine27-N2)-dimethyltransferase